MQNREADIAEEIIKFFACLTLAFAILMIFFGRPPNSNFFKFLSDYDGLLGSFATLLAGLLAYIAATKAYYAVRFKEKEEEKKILACLNEELIRFYNGTISDLENLKNDYPVFGVSEREHYLQKIQKNLFEFKPSLTYDNTILLKINTDFVESLYSIRSAINFSLDLIGCNCSSLKGDGSLIKFSEIDSVIGSLLATKFYVFGELMDYFPSDNRLHEKEKEIDKSKITYKYILFESEFDARWAVFLDNSGIRWEYEPEGFIIDKKRIFSCFYLPKLGYLVLQKEGYFYNESDLQAFAERLQAPLLLPINWDFNFSNGEGYLKTYCPKKEISDEALAWGYKDMFLICDGCEKVTIQNEVYNTIKGNCCDGSRQTNISYALDAARTANFE